MLFIFDMGGVVAANVTTLPGMAGRLGMELEGFLACCGIPPETAATAVFDCGLLADVQAGRIGSEGFWSAFRQTASQVLSAEDPARSRIETLTRQENLWETCFHPQPIAGTLVLIEALKDKGHRVVCGTNTLDVHFEVHLARGDYRVFDAVHASHQLGVIKPHREFWLRILAAEGVEPGGAVFVDDHPANVAAGREAGVASFLFTTPETLRRDLSSWL